MASIGRNDPCRCGSGKKYKKCCLASDERRLAEELSQPLVILDDGLEQLTNSVLDLVKKRRFDEAIAACNRLLREWPDVVDGLDRSALVYEAMGNKTLAIDFYRRAIEFTERPDQRDGFDQDLRDDWRDKIAELSARA